MAAQDRCAAASQPARAPAHALRPAPCADRAGGARFRLPSALKALIDGTIAAFHSHIGDGAEPLARVARALGRDADGSARLLRDDTRAALGIRRLVWNRGEGVQWNPADSPCGALEILVQTNLQPTWLCSGSPFTLQPAALFEMQENFRS